MKKNNLFKAVGIVILVYILLSWIAPIVTSTACTDEQTLCQLGITSIFSVVAETFSGFGTVVLFVFMVGAFYGVLKAIGAYDKMMNAWIAKATGREKCWLVTIMVVMAVISSIAGLDLGLLIVFPFLIGFVTRLGYNKLVALSATVGATIVGMFGAVFAGSLYGINNSLLSLGKYDQILVKVILFVVGLALLITFVLMYVKKNKDAFNPKAIKLDAKKETASKSSKSKKPVSKAKTKTVDAKVTEKKEVKKNIKKPVEKKKKEKVSKERSALPGFIVFGIVVLILFLGTVAWGNIFSNNFFDTAHTAWTEFKVGGFDILNKLFGGIAAFGSSDWNQSGPTRFQTYSMILLMGMVVLTLVYRKSIREAFDGFVEGMKSFVVPAIVVVLTCSVFVFTYYSPVIGNITSGLLGSDFNIATSGLYTILNSVFNVDYFYLANMLLYNVPSIYSDATTLSVFSVMFTSLYAVVMLVGPTSVLLLVSLSIADVDYTDWFKFAGRLALSLLFVAFAVFSFMLGFTLVGIILAALALLIFGIFNDSKFVSSLALVLAAVALSVFIFVTGGDIKLFSLSVSSVIIGIVLAGIAVLLAGLFTKCSIVKKLSVILTFAALSVFMFITGNIVFGIIFAVLTVACLLFVIFKK